MKDTLAFIPHKTVPSLQTCVSGVSWHHLKPSFKASVLLLSWLPWSPILIRNVHLPWSFWLWGRARTCTVAYPVRWMETPCYFCKRFSHSIHPQIFDSLKGHFTKENFQNGFRNVQEEWAKCIWSKGKVFWGTLIAAGHYYKHFFKSLNFWSHLICVLVTSYING